MIFIYNYICIYIHIYMNIFVCIYILIYVWYFEIRRSWLLTIHRKVRWEAGQQDQHEKCLRFPLWRVLRTGNTCCKLKHGMRQTPYIWDCLNRHQHILYIYTGDIYYIEISQHVLRKQRPSNFGHLQLCKSMDNKPNVVPSSNHGCTGRNQSFVLESSTAKWIIEANGWSFPEFSMSYPLEFNRVILQFNVVSRVADAVKMEAHTMEMLTFNWDDVNWFSSRSMQTFPPLINV